MPPTTSGLRALSTHSFISSIARSPASIETPAAAYVEGGVSVTAARSRGSRGWAAGPTSGPGQRVGRATATQRGGQPVDVQSEIRLEQVLAEELRIGQLDRVDAVEAGPAQVVGRH